MDAYTKSTDLDPKLREPVKFRVSQINGCVYCLSYRAADAKTRGIRNEAILSQCMGRKPSLLRNGEGCLRYRRQDEQNVRESF
ncbi:carboxymuconolactone decarboxylase family protein [Paenibacillus spongiae]|uniref:carboxymuconolactone decarboxylase family protein n=1 Tax=Paenibacillus spongiae TaxID=2909671 RepID=UPI0035A226E7